MIIAISGKTGTGKTTLASHLAAILPGTVLSFAHPLKDEVSQLFGLPRNWLDTQQGKARLVNGRSIRSILQLHGQQRRDEQPGYWVRAMAESIARTTGHIIVDDVRYNDELRMLRHGNGQAHPLRWALRLEPYPGWKPGPHSEHVSETALDNYIGWDLRLYPQYGDLEKCADSIKALIMELMRR